jgi:hypothetical protein
MEILTRAATSRRAARSAARLLLAALIAWVPWTGISSSTASAYAGEDPDLVRAVKAAFLTKFQIYVTWPDTAFDGPRSPFLFCIVGTDPFGMLIDRAVDGEYVAGHPIIVMRPPGTAATPHCHLVYVGTADPTAAQALVAAEAPMPVLTVTDDMSESFEGIINFVVVGGRVRFEIDNARAIRAGLAISSKLLDIAVPEGSTR